MRSAGAHVHRRRRGARLRDRHGALAPASRPRAPRQTASQRRRRALFQPGHQVAVMTHWNVEPSPIDLALLKKAGDDPLRSTTARLEQALPWRRPPTPRGRRQAWPGRERARPPRRVRPLAASNARPRSRGPGASRQPLRTARASGNTRRWSRATANRVSRPPPNPWRGGSGAEPPAASAPAAARLTGRGEDGGAPSRVGSPASRGGVDRRIGVRFLAGLGHAPDIRKRTPAAARSSGIGRPLARAQAAGVPGGRRPRGHSRRPGRPRARRPRGPVTCKRSLT